MTMQHLYLGVFCAALAIGGHQMEVAEKEKAIKPVAAEKPKQFDPNVVEADKIVCREIKVVDEDGNTGITMLSRNGVKGIWLNGARDTQGIAIVAGKGTGTFISLYDMKAPNYTSGFQWAVVIDPDGKPYLQFADEDGKMKWVSFDKLK
jgi:hypothetical protein